MWLFYLYLLFYFHFNEGEENIDPAELALEKRRQKYASLPEEEKERRHAMDLDWHSDL